MWQGKLNMKYIYARLEDITKGSTRMLRHTVRQHSTKHRPIGSVSVAVSAFPTSLPPLPALHEVNKKKNIYSIQ